MPRHVLLFCFILLFSVYLSGCSSVFPAKEGEQDEGIKVLTVAFGSREPIPNTKVIVRDLDTDKLITTAIGNSEGELTLHLERNRRYLFIPSHEDFKNEETANVSKVIKIKDDTTYVVLETYNQEDKAMDVPVVLQKPELPHGCEITAMTAAFNYYGLNLSKVKMARNYLPTQPLINRDGKRIGPDPAKAYAGDPANVNTGTYVFAKVIEKAAKKVSKDYHADIQVQNLTGANKQKIIGTVKQGIPVMMWVTLDLTKPQTKEGWYIEGTMKKMSMYRNLHVVVLTGYDDGKVIVMDPLHGYVSHSASKFFASYKDLGKQAIALKKH